MENYLSELISKCESDEELHFLYYAEELHQLGFIKEIKRGVSIELIPKVQIDIPQIGKSGKAIKNKSKILLNNMSYTPDYIIIWNNVEFLTSINFISTLPDNTIFLYSIIDEEPSSVIEIKSSYNQFNSSLRVFGITQKVLYHTKGLYSQKIIPKDLFSSTFLPDKCRYTSKGKLRMISGNYKTIKQYFKLT